MGDQITELCSYLYAAEARLFTLIREFDAKKCWAEQGALIVKALEMAIARDFVAGDDSDDDSSNGREQECQPVAAKDTKPIVDLNR